RRVGGTAHQLRLSAHEVRLAVEPPQLGVEREGWGAGTARAFVRSVERNARACAGKIKAAGPRNDDLVLVKLEGEVVRDRLDRDAVGGRQRVKLDEALRAQKTARRPERRHYKQIISDFRIHESVQLLRHLEWDDSAAPLRCRSGAGDGKRPGRF